MDTFRSMYTQYLIDSENAGTVGYSSDTKYLLKFSLFILFPSQNILDFIVIIH